MKMISYLKFLAFLAFCLLVSSCKVRKPSDVIPEATMEDLLYDYHIAKALGENLPYNENYKKALYLESVFDKYNVTEAEFDSSMVWYARNVDVLAKIYDRLNSRAKTKQNDFDRLIALRDKKPMISLPGDSIDVWAWKRIMRLRNTPLYKNYSFILPADTNFKQRDEFEWVARYNYMGNTPDSTLLAMMAMQIVFSNDSTVGAIKRINQSGFDTLRLAASMAKDIREVRGFLYYPNLDSISELLVDKISLMRYRSLDTISIDSLNIKELSADSVKKEVISDSSAINTTASPKAEPLKETPLRGPRSPQRSAERPQPNNESMERIKQMELQ